MHPFFILMGSIVLLVISSVIGARTDKDALRATMQGLSVACFFLIVGTVLFGLWQAWSPWDFQVVDR